MPNDPSIPDPAHVSTAGDFSPGIVMGNYTVNTLLTPKLMPLEEAFQISLSFTPSYRGYFIDLDSEKKAFVNGCKFEMRIGNSGVFDIDIVKMYLEINVQDTLRPALPDKERGYGAFYVAHKLFIDVYRESAPGWWLISDGMKHSEPRKFVDAREDILESDLNPRLRIRLKPGETESIEGGLTPCEDGLFEIKFVFGIASTTERILNMTDSIYIIKGDMIKQVQNRGD